MFFGGVEAETLQRGLHSFFSSLLNKMHKQTGNHRKNEKCFSRGLYFESRDKIISFSKEVRKDSRAAMTVEVPE